MGTATITEWDRAAEVATSGGIALTVDFDPKTLSLTYTPTGTTTAAAQTATGTHAKTPPQQTGQSSALTVELTFDTTTTGGSVQEKTDQLVRLTYANEQSRRVVRFSWGSFLFFGTVQAMTQTIDFFSEAGVPLRAAVNLTLSEVARPNPDSSRTGPAPTSSFGANAGIGASVGASASFGAGASFRAGASLGASAGASLGVRTSMSAGLSTGASIGTTPLTLSQAGDTISAIAARAGAGVSWKSVAAANGIDNPRLLSPGTILDAHARIG